VRTSRLKNSFFPSRGARRRCVYDASSYTLKTVLRISTTKSSSMAFVRTVNLPRFAESDNRMDQKGCGWKLTNVRSAHTRLITFWITPSDSVFYFELSVRQKHHYRRLLRDRATSVLDYRLRAPVSSGSISIVPCRHFVSGKKLIYYIFHEQAIPPPASLGQREHELRQGLNVKAIGLFPVLSHIQYGSKYHLRTLPATGLWCESGASA